MTHNPKLTYTAYVMHLEIVWDHWCGFCLSQGSTQISLRNKEAKIFFLPKATYKPKLTHTK